MQELKAVKAKENFDYAREMTRNEKTLTAFKKDIENYFHCEIIEGTPRLGGEELEIMTDSNYYEPMYMDINELKNKNFQRMDVVNKAINKKYE